MNAPDMGTAFRNDAPPARGLRGGGVLPAELLAPFTVLDDRRAALAVATTVVPILALLALGATVWTPWVVLLTLPFTAALQQALFVLAHEAAHYRLFSDRRLNEGVGRLLGAVVGISMCTYRVVHRLHHNHLYGALDPDIAMNGGYPRGRRYLLRKLATDISGRTAWKTYGYFFGNPATNVATNEANRPLDDTSPALRDAALRDRRFVIGVQIAMPLAALLLAGPAGLAKYLVLWVLPALTVLQVILRVRAIAEHGAPVSFDSPLTAARTHVPGPLGRLFLFPHHVGYHVEHHLYPAVPHYHLPALHALLAARGVLDGIEPRPFLATWRRVYAEPAARG
jgi:fatty acid desaturase